MFSKHALIETPSWTRRSAKITYGTDEEGNTTKIISSVATGDQWTAPHCFTELDMDSTLESGTREYQEYKPTSATSPDANLFGVDCIFLQHE